MQMDRDTLSCKLSISAIYKLSVDPGVKVDPGYKAYELGLRMNIYIKKSDGVTPIRNKVWPGITTFPDFTNSMAFDYWRDLTVEWLDQVPIDGLWIDMNVIKILLIAKIFRNWQHFVMENAIRRTVSILSILPIFQLDSYSISSNFP
jgi:hypothetical protein